MSNKMKVMIAEDNKALAEQIREQLDRSEEFEVCGVASGGRDAERMLMEGTADILIMDLILPDGDGFYLLEKIASGDLPKTPITMVVSSMRQESIIARALAMGAQYYMVKPVSSDLLYRRLLDLADLKQPPIARAVPSVRKRSLDEKITSIFLSIGIPAHIKGYQFLREGIKMVIDRPDSISSITKVLYPGIAERFETTPSKVERAIRHAIEVAWTRGRIENINEIFGYNIYSKNDKPTNGEFIALIADRLILEKTA